MTMPRFIKHILLIISGMTLILCLVWAVMAPGWGSTTTAMFSLIAFLTVASDPSISERLSKFRPTAIDKAGQALSTALKARHEKPPIEMKSFSLENEPESKHEVGVYLIKDSRNSGLIKAVVHRAPSADPYDVMTVEGAQPQIEILDLDNDGLPELFVDTTVGAHTHSVSVFRLNGQNRFHEVLGSPLFADWGPVSLDPVEGSPNWKITILKGSGAAGSNAKPHIYILTDRGLAHEKNEKA